MRMPITVNSAPILEFIQRLLRPLIMTVVLMWTITLFLVDRLQDAVMPRLSGGWIAIAARRVAPGQPRSPFAGQLTTERLRYD